MFLCKFACWLHVYIYHNWLCSHIHIVFLYAVFYYFLLQWHTLPEGIIRVNPIPVRALCPIIYLCWDAFLAKNKILGKQWIVLCNKKTTTNLDVFRYNVTNTSIRLTLNSTDVSLKAHYEFRLSFYICSFGTNFFCRCSEVLVALGHDV